MPTCFLRTVYMTWTTRSVPIPDMYIIFADLYLTCTVLHHLYLPIPDMYYTICTYLYMACTTKSVLTYTWHAFSTSSVGTYQYLTCYTPSVSTYYKCQTCTTPSLTGRYLVSTVPIPDMNYTIWILVSTWPMYHQTRTLLPEMYLPIPALQVPTLTLNVPPHWFLLYLPDCTYLLCMHSYLPAYTNLPEMYGIDQSCRYRTDT